MTNELQSCYKKEFITNYAENHLHNL